MKKNKILIVLIITFSFLLLGCQNELELQKQSLTYNTVAPIIGESNAPVTMVYYYDYQCRWCKDFDLNTYPLLIPYVDDGSLKIIFKDIAFIGEDSVKSAMAAKCVYKEFGTQKFLEYHKRLYENQKTKNTGWVTNELLNDLAKEIYLDEQTLRNCQQSEKYVDELKANTDEAFTNGITSTPSFIINDQKFSGSLPLSNFKEIIEDAKNKKR